MRWLCAIAVALSGSVALAQQADGPDHAGIAARAVAAHILPAYQSFADAAEGLSAPAEACAAEDLRTAYHVGFDAWMEAQHIAFGPVEGDMRRFAIAFWPDTKGFTRKALKRLTANEDEVVDDPDAFAKVSVAARGLLALEWTLFDEDGARRLATDYQCRLIQAIARDLNASALGLLGEWRGETGFARTFLAPGPANPLYPEPQDVTRDLFTSLDAGLQALVDLRLGRPLGSFERPRPKRAEAWRSGRALRNIEISLGALREFYTEAFAPEVPAIERAAISAAFERSLTLVRRAPTPITDAVAAPQTRFQIEAIQSQLLDLQRRLRESLAPALGVTLGFNSLDGD